MGWEPDADLAELVICALKGTPTPFLDNEEGICVRCGTEVIFRPTAPKKPKMCIRCVLTPVN